MKRWIAIFMSVVPLVASAASFWDGSAALQRGDSSFESGLYAVSDSFAAETVIEVENLDSGATARVTVREGAPGQPGILVLLSPKAAEALGIPAGSVARVRITLAARASSELASLDQERVTNPDPEVSAAPAPIAEVSPVEPEPVEPTPVEPTPVEPTTVEPTTVEPATAEPAPVEPEPVEPTTVEPTTVEPTPVEPTTVEPTPVEPTTVQEPPVEIAQAEPAPVEPPPAEAGVVETPTAEAPLAEDEQLLKELAARSPQKQLFQPPREDEKFAYQQPVEPPQPGIEVAAAQPEPEPEIPAALPEAESTLPSPTPEPLAIPPLEQPTAAQPAIESADTAPQPATAGSMPADLAEAQAPPEVTPELSDRIAATTEPDTSRPPRLPVPEPLAREQEPPAAVAPAAEPAAKPQTVAALPPQTIAPKTETSPIAATPPKAQPIQQPAAAVEQKPAVQPARVLPPVSKTTPYYVQLAAYSAESLATGLAASLAATYPVVVLAPAQSGAAIYRVLIGPLNKAESGTLLRMFRNRGFPDAFVKQE